MDLGCLPTVIICDYDLIQEVMKSESFSGRPHPQIPGFQHTRGFDDRGCLSGLTVTWGKPWREHKKFMQTTVNDLATGKKGYLEIGQYLLELQYCILTLFLDVLDEIIVQEAESILHNLDKEVSQNKGNVLFAKRFTPSINNVIWRILTGKTTNINDPEVIKLSKAVNEIFHGMDASFINTLQTHSHFIFGLCRALGIKTFVNYSQKIMKMLKEEVLKYKPDSEGFYIERNLAEIQNRENDPDHVYHKERGRMQMMGTIFDLFIAGYYKIL